MEKIKKVWFEKGRIYMASDKKHIYSRLLVDFPLLRQATDTQRKNYKIVLNGQALRWEEIDEDIHISSFYETADTRNEVAGIFYNFPMLTVTGVAEQMGINKNLLYNYVYGLKKPSAKRISEIKDTIRALGIRMSKI